MFFYAVFLQYESKFISKENIDSYLNFILLKNTLNDIVFLFQKGLKGNMNLFNNIFGNIVLFMPLPFFLNRIFNIQKSAAIVFIGLLLSVWVEAMQYLFILGVTDIDDVLLNVLGTYLGCVLILNVFKMKVQSDKKI